MTDTMPLRVPTTVTAGVITRPPARHRKKAERMRPKRIVLAPRARVALGRRIRIAGQVRTRGAGAIPGAEVQVLSRSATAAEQLVAVVHTDRDGQYEYLTRASATRVFRVVFPGTQTALPSQHEVTVLVPAASTIASRPGRVVNGQAVTFVGHLQSLPVPAAGKLVELQVVLSGRWQTFQTVRTDARGIWRVHYRFRRTCGLLRYRFRARVPTEAGYPYEGAHTRAVTVRVRGEACG